MADQIVLDEIREQISTGLIQGAVVRTNLSDETIAMGVQFGNIPMSAESRFDIASTGKIFTAACAALLALEGKIDLDAPFTEYLPEHILGKKCNITLRDLGSHSSGFDNSKPYAADAPEENMQRLNLWMPVNPRRSIFCYSCGNYILLGKIIERVTGMDLDALSRKLLWEPLNMSKTTWYAPGPGPFEVQHHSPTREPGLHNDDVCFRVNVPMGSGSAFSTAGDMFLFVNDIIERKVFPAAYYDLILKPEFFQEGKPCRTFGWDMRTDALPEGLSPRTIHHTGFTGQSVFADPETGICGVVLTSRTGNWLQAKKARSRIMELIIEASRKHP
ncbi:MAG: beta-lactamase family protein [Lentisphaerae bacterium]|nr:beta-lactamase family protein [Lentisphaerota bacterium]